MNRSFHLFSTRILFLASVVLMTLSINVQANQVSEEIKNLLAHHVPEFSGNKWYEDTFSPAERWLFDVYETAAFRPLWLTESGIRPDAAVLVDYLLNADQHGLEPRTYGGEAIAALFDNTDPEARARLDVALTAGFLNYAHDLSEGRSKARTAYPELFAEAGNDEFDPHYAMSQLTLSDGVRGYLDSLAPQHGRRPG